MFADSAKESIVQSHAIPAPRKTNHLEMVETPSRTQVTSHKHPDLNTGHSNTSLNSSEVVTPIKIDILAPYLRNYSHGPYLTEGFTSGYKLGFFAQTISQFIKLTVM